MKKFLALSISIFVVSCSSWFTSSKESDNEPLAQAESVASAPDAQANTPASAPVAQANAPVSPPVAQANTPASPPVAQANTPASPPVAQANTTPTLGTQVKSNSSQDSEQVVQSKQSSDSTNLKK